MQVREGESGGPRHSDCSSLRLLCVHTSSCIRLWLVSAACQHASPVTLLHLLATDSSLAATLPLPCPVLRRPPHTRRPLSKTVRFNVLRVIPSAVSDKKTFAGF